MKGANSPVNTPTCFPVHKSFTVQDELNPKSLSGTDTLAESGGTGPEGSFVNTKKFIVLPAF